MTGGDLGAQAAVGATPPPGPAAPGGEQAQGMAGRPEEPRELVQCRTGPLGEQEEQRAQRGQHQVARQREEHRPGREVAQQHQQRVAAVLPPPPGGGRRLPPPPGRGLHVVDDRVGDHAHPVARGLDAPAEVDVLPVEQHAGIEAAHLVPHVAADQHPGAAHGEHIPVAVVLPLVDLARLDPGDPAPGAVDADPGLEQDVPVGPVHDLGAEHRHGRHLVGAEEQLLQRVRFRLAVVVEQPHPLRPLGRGSRRRRQMGGGGPVPQRLVDRGRVAGAAVHAEHGGTAQRLGQHGPAAVPAAGVDANHALHGPGLVHQGLGHTRNPRGAIVGDDDRGDDVLVLRVSWRQESARCSKWSPAGHPGRLAARSRHGGGTP